MIRISSLVASALLVLASSAHSQTFTTIVNSPANERGIYAAALSTGGFVAVGNSDNADDEDALVVLFDSTGKLITRNTYGGRGNDMGWAFAESRDGLTIVGSTDSFGNGGSDCYLVGVDAMLNERWSQTMGSAEDEFCWGVTTMDSGHIAIVGQTASPDTEEDCLLIVADSDGQELWQQSYGGDKSDRCFAVAQTEDSGFLLVGQSFSYGNGDRDMYVIKTDSTGKMLWDNIWGGSESDVGHGIAPTRDGGFLVTGYTTSYATTPDDPMVLKLNASGEEEWLRVLEIDRFNRAITGVQTTDGTYVVTGFSQHHPESPKQVLIAGFSEDGQEEWTDTFAPGVDGRDSMGYTINGTEGGGFVVTGHVFLPSVGRNAMYVRKYEHRQD